MDPHHLKMLYQSPFGMHAKFTALDFAVQTHNFTLAVSLLALGAHHQPDFSLPSVEPCVSGFTYLLSHRR